MANDAAEHQISWSIGHGNWFGVILERLFPHQHVVLFVFLGIVSTAHIILSFPSPLFVPPASLVASEWDTKISCSKDASRIVPVAVIQRFQSNTKSFTKISVGGAPLWFCTRSFAAVAAVAEN